MVAETKEKMTEFVETMTENVRVAVDAGRRSQESVFKSVGEIWKNQPEFDGWFGKSDKVWRDAVPFFGKNARMFTDLMDTTFRSGMEVAKTACDAVSTIRPEEGDANRKTRQVWDAAMDATISNFDAFGKFSSRAIENWAEFFRGAVRTDNAAKSAPKTGK